MGIQQAQSTGSFIPTSSVWDVGQLQDIDVNSQEFKEILVRLYQNLNQMALSVNGKDSGIYHTDEFVTGQQFFPNPALDSSTTSTPDLRQVCRKTVNLSVNLPNAGMISEAHNIDIQPGWTFTRIYGAASDTTNRLFTPLPNQDIKIRVTATHVEITTLADYSAYNTCYVVLEYLKS